MTHFSSKQLVLFALIGIVLLGFFLRAYNFSPWLHFELDQARDARVVDAALRDGADELPLLGPKAGGTFLRLAPGFYYLQYLSAAVFGGSPASMAAFILIFSVLSIPLFYLLVKRFFPIGLSLGLALLFAVSEYFVMYGRFAWNPNLLPFFMLLGMYALLRAVDTEEQRKNLWFVVAIGAFVLATHFHFLAFLAAPVIVGLFLLFKRPRFSWKAWLSALVLVFVMYLPMALNEIETGGTNTEEFFGAITKKSTKEEHSLVEKAIRDASEHALHGIVIATGFEGGTFPAFFVDDRLKWICQGKCDEGKWYGVAAVLVLLSGILAALYFGWKETDQKKRDFILLCGIWFDVTFLLFLPLAYGMAPRFFLLSGPLFFIFIGLVLLFLTKVLRGGRVARSVVWVTILALVFSNLFFLKERFSEMARAGSEPVVNQPDRILKERIRVTLEQQNAIVDMLQKRSQETGYPVYMFSEPQHRRALKYLMEKRGMENAVLGFDGVYRQGVYYLIFRSQSNIENALKKYHTSYTIGERTPFGTLTVIELFPKAEAIIGERQDFSIPKPNDSQAPPRYTWREFFERNSSASSGDQETGLEEREDFEKDQQ